MGKIGGRRACKHRCRPGGTCGVCCCSPGTSGSSTAPTQADDTVQGCKPRVYGYQGHASKVTTHLCKAQHTPALPAFMQATGPTCGKASAGQAKNVCPTSAPRNNTPHIVPLSTATAHSLSASTRPAIRTSLCHCPSLQHQHTNTHCLGYATLHNVTAVVQHDNLTSRQACRAACPLATWPQPPAQY